MNQAVSVITLCVSPRCIHENIRRWNHCTHFSETTWNL